MAKLSRQDGPLPYLVRWRDVDGHQPKRSFARIEEANECLAAALIEEAQRRKGHRMGRHSEPAVRAPGRRGERPSRQTTVRQFGPIWLSTLHVEPETIEKYEGTLFPWTYRLFGDLQLRHVTEQDVADLDLQMREAKLSSARRRDVMLNFRSLMEEAKRQGLVSVNVVRQYYDSRGMKLPSGKRKRMPQPFGKTQRPVLYSALGVVHSKWELFARLGIGTALRPGELWSVRVWHFELDRQLLRVATSVTRKGRFKQTKEETDDLIPLTPGLVRRVREYITEAGLGPDDLLFANSAGKPFDPGNFRDRVWDPTLEAAGLRGYWIEDLRHTSASMLIDDGADIVKVSKFLRHKDESTTLRHYAHMFPGGLDDIREKMITLIDEE